MGIVRKVQSGSGPFFSRFHSFVPLHRAMPRGQGTPARAWARASFHRPQCPCSVLSVLIRDSPYLPSVLPRTSSRSLVVDNSQVTYLNSALQPPALGGPRPPSIDLGPPKEPWPGSKRWVHEPGTSVVGVLPGACRLRANAVIRTVGYLADSPEVNVRRVPIRLYRSRDACCGFVPQANSGRHSNAGCSSPPRLQRL